MDHKLPTEDEIEIEILAEPDDLPLEGNVQDSGDPEADRAADQTIRERLERGDVWAWAVVTVRGTWHGYVASDALGGCSYENEADFRERGDYFEDMRHNVWEQIREAADYDARVTHIEERARQLAHAHGQRALRGVVDLLLDLYAEEPHR